MSAERIVRRRSWTAACPSVFDRTAKRRAAAFAMTDRRDARTEEELIEAEAARVKLVRYSSPRTTYHVYAIAQGWRARTFQLHTRGRRLDAGLAETSSAMQAPR